MLNSVGLQGPGPRRPGWRSDLPALTACRGPGGGQHLGPVGRRLRPGRGHARPASAARRRPGGGRGQRELPQPGGPLADVRPLASATARPWPPPSAGCRAGPSSARTCPTSPPSPRRRPGGRRGGPHPDQHAAGAGHRHRDGPPRARCRRRRALGCRAPSGGGAGGVGVPGGVPRARPSSVPAGWRRAGMRSSSCGPAPTPCRWGRRSSATRGPRGRCCASSIGGARPGDNGGGARARPGRGREGRTVTATGTAIAMKGDPVEATAKLRRRSSATATSFGGRVAEAVGRLGPFAPASTRPPRSSARGGFPTTSRAPFVLPHLRGCVRRGRRR